MGLGQGLAGSQPAFVEVRNGCVSERASERRTSWRRADRRPGEGGIARGHGYGSPCLMVKPLHQPGPASAPFTAPPWGRHRELTGLFPVPGCWTFRHCLQTCTSYK